MKTIPNDWFLSLPYEIVHKIDLICAHHDLRYADFLAQLINDALADVPGSNATCSHTFHHHPRPRRKNPRHPAHITRDGDAP